MNNSAQMPNHLRFDVITESPNLPAIPDLIPDSSIVLAPGPDGQVLYDQIRSKLEAKREAREANKPSKSLAGMLSTIPPLPLDSVPKEHIDDFTAQTSVGYLSQDHFDEFNTRLDVAIERNVPVETYDPHGYPPRLSEKELEVRNPNSVYNWLREHEPQVFLQDGEEASASATSGKPGSLRGAGKRASIPAPSKPDAVEFVEEDGLGYDASFSRQGSAAGLGTAKSKRKRLSEDEVGYRPRGGSTRPTKKKKKEGKEEGGSRRSSMGGRGRGKGNKDGNGTPFAGNPDPFAK
jgi:hypothetical protein